MKRFGVLACTATLVIAAACSNGTEQNKSDVNSVPSPLDTIAPPPGSSDVLDRNGNVIGWMSIAQNESIIASGGDLMDLVRFETASNSTIRDVLIEEPGSPITTTFDGELQTLLEAAIGFVPTTGGRFVVSAVAIDVATGELVAVADSAPGSSLAMFLRPTGSVLKFVVALAAISAGAQADDLIDGGERCVLPSRSSTNPGASMSFVGDPGFAPGELSDVTAFSVNCAFAKLYEIVGGDEVIAMAARLGLDDVTDDTPRIVIGSQPASPLQLARAMGVVLGDGSLTTPPVVNARAGDPVTTRSTRIQVVDRQVAQSTANLLTNVVERGTAQPNRLAADRLGAGKTGTQQGNTDAWFVGGTPEYAVAVWMGNPADPSDGMIGVPEFGGVARVQGGSFPAAVWKRFLDAALAATPASAWSGPAPTRDPVRLLLPSIECSDTELLALELPSVPYDAVISNCP